MVPPAPKPPTQAIEIVERAGSRAIAIRTTRMGKWFVGNTFTWVGFLGVRIPLAYFLALPRVDLGPLGAWPGCGLGLFGAWLAMFADLLVRGTFFVWRFAGGAWQGMRV